MIRQPRARSRDVAQPASRALEVVARRQGYRVRRLLPDYVVVDGAHRRRMAFAGLLGTSVTRPAVVLTGDLGLTRAHLEAVGVGCVPFRAQPVGQSPPTWPEIEELSAHLRVRRAEPDPTAVDVGRYVSDERGLLAAWSDRCWDDESEDGPARVLAEPDFDGEDHDVYVVGTEVLAGFVRTRRVGRDPVPRPEMTPHAVPADVAAIALVAIDAMPGTGYGTVRIQRCDSGQPARRVYGVELAPPPALLGSATQLRLAAEAVLEHETGAAIRGLGLTARLRRRVRRGLHRPTARG